MKHHLKGCLEDTSPDDLILHHGTNNLKSDDNSEKTASDIVDLGLSLDNEKTIVYISSLIIRNVKLDKKRKEVNDFIKQQCLTNHLCFIDNENINLRMLNKSGLHLSENDTKRLVNNFCFSMTKWHEIICLDRPTTTTEVFLKRKKVNKNLCSDFSTVNTDRSIITHSRNSNNKRNKERFFLSINECSNAFDSVKVHKLVNPKIIAAEELMRDKIDICLFSETKLDETFPNQQFKIHGYKIYCRDRNKHGGGILCYVNENILCKMVNIEGVPDDCEIILIEFSIKTRKWLCIGLYKPPSQNDKNFLDDLSLILNNRTCQFDNFILMGDFNLTVEDKNIEVFTRTFDMECLINKPKCFQSAKPNCIGLILTNKKELFKNSKVLEVGISHYHSFIVTTLKSQLIKGNAKMKLYRDYSSFQWKCLRLI